MVVFTSTCTYYSREEECSDGVGLAVPGQTFPGLRGLYSALLHIYSELYCTQQFRDSAGWATARITFRQLDRHFLVLFRGGGPATKKDALYLAVDDVRVTDGVC